LDIALAQSTYVQGDLEVQLTFDWVPFVVRRNTIDGVQLRERALLLAPNFPLIDVWEHVELANPPRNAVRMVVGKTFCQERG